MTDEAVILAGGFGTRLSNVVSDRPKSMALINDKPFLEYQMAFLKQAGIRTVVLSVGYMKELIIDHFRDEYLGMKIKYAVENTPLGTGGGLLNALQLTGQSPVLTLNGDSIFTADIRGFYKFFRQKSPDIALALKALPDVSRYGAVLTNENQRIVRFEEKSDRQGKGVINAGIYLLNTEQYRQAAPEQKKFSVENDIFAKQVSRLNIYGYISQGTFIDIGIPEDYEKARDVFKTIF